MENSNKAEIKKYQTQFALLSLFSTPIFILMALASMAYFGGGAMFEFLENRETAFTVLSVCTGLVAIDLIMAYRITMKIKSLEDGNT